MADARAALARREIRRRQANGTFIGSSVIEPLITMGSAIIAEPVSGYAGLLAAPFVGADKAANVVRNVQDSMTIQPWTEEGQAGMEAVGDVLAPVGEALEGASSYLGDKTLDITGSPALAAAAYSAPTAALELLGLKGASKLSKGAKYEMGDIGRKPLQKQRGVFAGVKAKGADLDAKSAAEELANRGVSRDEIWAKTGWYKGVDGAWRFEIDDSGVDFKGRDIYEELAAALEDGDMDKAQALNTEAKTYKQSYDRRSINLGDALEHEALFEAYPDMEKIKLKNKKMGLGSDARGSYDPSGDSITLQKEAAKGTKKSYTLHEIQHAIQQREGFAKGGSASKLAWADNTARPTLMDEYNKLKADIVKPMEYQAYKNAAWGEVADTPEVKAAYNDYVKTTKKALTPEIDRDLQSTAAMNVYRRLAGEAEARNVQTRMNMTPEERRATPPWKTLDVPEDELIVRMEGGKAMSVRKEAIKELERRGKLDMSESARMQRAVEQGYDVGDVWYHGSRNDITEFSNDKLGSGTGAKSARYGHFLTKDPAVASRFAGSDGAVYPVYTRGDNYIDAGALASRKDPRLIPRMGGSAPTRKGGAPVEQWDKDPHDIIFNEMKTNKGSLNSLSDKDARQYISERMSAGVSGFDIPDTWYDALLDHYSGYPQGHDVRVVFDPKDIRGVNADFDPANIGKNKLLGSADPRILPATGAAALAAEKLLREEED